MNEFEIMEKSATIYDLSQEISIQNREDLSTAVEILQNVKNHRTKVVKYWHDAKGAAEKVYKEICTKEKEMLKICDETEKILKNEILCYKSIQERKATKLSEEVEKHRKQEVEKLLNESVEAQENGDEETAKCKLRQAEMIKNLEKYTIKIFYKPDGVTVQRRWQSRITNNELVPAFFNGIEIREINISKLLEIRKTNPSVKIPGVKFYQKETIAVKN